MEDLSGLGISLCGIFYVTAYFYFQRVEQKNIKKRGCVNVEAPLAGSGSYPSHAHQNQKQRDGRDNTSTDSAALFTLPLESEASAGGGSIFERHSEF